MAAKRFEDKRHFIINGGRQMSQPMDEQEAKRRRQHATAGAHVARAVEHLALAQEAVADLWAGGHAISSYYLDQLSRAANAHLRIAAGDSE
jgi:hypothetical protein